MDSLDCTASRVNPAIREPQALVDWKVIQAFREWQALTERMVSPVFPACLAPMDFQGFQDSPA